jgi:hypothetical protein
MGSIGTAGGAGVRWDSAFRATPSVERNRRACRKPVIASPVYWSPTFRNGSTAYLSRPPRASVRPEPLTSRGSRSAMASQIAGVQCPYARSRRARVTARGSKLRLKDWDSSRLVAICREIPHRAPDRPCGVYRKLHADVRYAAFSVTATLRVSRLRRGLSGSPRCP